MDNHCFSLYLCFYFTKQRGSMINLSVNVFMFISDATISYHTIKVCPVKYLLLQPEGTSACCTVETKNSIVESIQVISIVRNNAKRRISKRLFQEKKACQNFWKTNIPYPLICTRKYQEVKNVRFLENLAFWFLKNLAIQHCVQTPVLRSEDLLYCWWY